MQGGCYMIKFPFIPQIKKELHNSQQNHPSFDSQKLLNKMMFITLFDNHPDAVFMVDVDGEIIHFNNSVKLLFGYTDQTIVHDFERYFSKEIQVRTILILPCKVKLKIFRLLSFTKVKEVSMLILPIFH